MRDDTCVRFLQWCLPRLRMRWRGFRKVRSQVCKRLGRRLTELGLPDLDAYRRHLELHEEEWARLDLLCRITISRFCRDRGVFEALRREILPALCSAVPAGNALRCWSAGCASGEEAYTLRILWAMEAERSFPGVSLRITATDIDAHLLDRAREGAFRESAMRELPSSWRAELAGPEEGILRVPPRLTEGITWLVQDIRREGPPGPFDLVLCRNLAFTYYDEKLQHEVLRRIAGVMRPGGALVLGRHEALPADAPSFEPWLKKRGIYRRSE